MIKTILFDLDGTLLPMDQDEFVKAYFGGLAKKAAPRGYEPQKLIDSVWKGTMEMVKNQGEKTNEEVFWDFFASVHGPQARNDLPMFDDFYRNEFQKVQEVCGFNPLAQDMIRKCKEKGYRLFLATNPLFPRIATESRVRWAGLCPEDFEGITTYENSRHCKPNPEYYRDIVSLLDINPKECLMVGNDVEEDMVAGLLGMKTFLLTDCLINQKGRDLTDWKRGSFEDLWNYLESQG